MPSETDIGEKVVLTLGKLGELTTMFHGKDKTLGSNYHGHQGITEELKDSCFW